ncbi:unnamed protein product, partial [Lota lota]
CAIISDDPSCLTQTVKCWGMEGRFINLYRSSVQASYLQFCEVKVYGGRNPVHHYLIIKGGWVYQYHCWSTIIGQKSNG